MFIDSPLSLLSGIYDYLVVNVNSIYINSFHVNSGNSVFFLHKQKKKFLCKKSETDSRFHVLNPLIKIIL